MAEHRQRNSSIELLRIISMLGVVILHYNNKTAGGAFKYVLNGSLNQYYLYLTESLFICAVDLFIMISAYYLCKTKKRRLIKVVELIFQVIVFNLAFYFVSVFLGEVFSVESLLITALPNKYFVILYSALYIISPYLNIIIERLSKDHLKKLIICLLILFSVWPMAVDILEAVLGGKLNGLSTIGLYGSQSGYTIVNFTLMYFVGAYIRVNEVSLSKSKALITAFLSCFGIWLFAIYEHRSGLNSITAWHYNNPLIILCAFSILVFTLNFNFSNRLINELSGGAFTCYLFHEPFMKNLGIQTMVTKSVGALAAHQIICAVSLYLLAYLAFKLYYFVSKPIIHRISPLLNKIDISVEE